MAAIVYKEKKIPDDFELVFDWKVAEGSNSGVYYRPTQYEYQILDNGKHADGKNPRTSAASLYFCMPPSHDNTKTPGEWNQGRIVCKGTVIQHWLNGEKVLGFDYTDPKYAQQVKMLSDRGGNLKARGAYLSLQDHGDPVWYRNIQLRELGPDDKLDRTPVTPAELTEGTKSRRGSQVETDRGEPSTRTAESQSQAELIRETLQHSHQDDIAVNDHDETQDVFLDAINDSTPRLHTLTSTKKLSLN